MRKINLDGIEVSDNTTCYVIAEIGHNHQGKVEICKELILKAKSSGANAVKLQKRSNKDLFTKEIYNSVYENRNAYGKTYGEHREFLEFDEVQYKELIEFSKANEISFFATAFDFQSLDFLEKLDIPMYKIASGDLLNIPLIKYVASTNKPIIVSTGGSEINDVKRVNDTISPINKNIAILQCTAGYPPAYKEMNLNVIPKYREIFTDKVIGLSSHDSGIALDVVAYVLGARIIEKHFTLNRANKGTDHSFSLEPQGLEKLIRDIKRTDIALGDGIKTKYSSEKKPLYKMGKKLVFARDIKKNQTITKKDIAIKSPNDGIQPYKLEEYVNKKINRDVKKDENLNDEIFS